MESAFTAFDMVVLSGCAYIGTMAAVGMLYAANQVSRAESRGEPPPLKWLAMAVLPGLLLVATGLLVQ